MDEIEEKEKLAVGLLLGYIEPVDIGLGNLSVPAAIDLLLNERDKEKERRHRK